MIADMYCNVALNATYTLYVATIHGSNMTYLWETVTYILIVFPAIRFSSLILCRNEMEYVRQLKLIYAIHTIIEVAAAITYTHVLAQLLFPLLQNPLFFRYSLLLLLLVFDCRPLC